MAEESTNVAQTTPGPSGPEAASPSTAGPAQGTAAAPSAAQTAAPVTIQIQPGQNVELSAVIVPGAAVAMQGRDLVITRPDQPPVVVRDFAASATAQAAVTLANGVVIPASQLITVTQQLGNAAAGD